MTKKELHNQLNNDVAAFLANGGSVETVKSQKTPKTQWVKDFHYHSALTRFDNSINDKAFARPTRKNQA